ncbi:MAG TPA: FecR domain-containing protein [Puia sp.]|jgi:ferric-dicitrate binding protein FerR (iron transport regulator)
MDNPIDIDPIVTKYLREENLSSEEQAALDLWISQGEGRSQMLDNLKNDTNSTKANLLQLEQVSNARIWDIVDARVKQDGFWSESEAISAPVLTGPQPAVRRLWPRFVMAASVLLILAGGAWWGLHRNPVAPAIVAAHPPKPADVAPGGNRATLTLADGRQINLDSSAIGVLASQGNMQVSKLSDGQLAYHKASEEKPQSPAYNVLSTPRAGQFSLTLPDGSRVWLNNASSLRYPIAFTGAHREVELSGEAYFEVAKDATRPFFVHTTGGPAGPATIEVLGTAFNIMAYNDESSERATLVDGSIRYIHAGNSTLLKPEEQSVLDADGSLKTLQHVDVDEITAWKNGYFHFDHASLETTMRQIARWYDISVEYQGTIPPQQFVGKIQRNMPLSNLLKGLSGEHIHFSVEDRKVVVTP